MVSEIVLGFLSTIIMRIKLLVDRLDVIGASQSNPLEMVIVSRDFLLFRANVLGVRANALPI